MAEASPRWEPLGHGVGVYLTPANAFTTDALLLAAFSQPGPWEAAADLGTGSGVIPLLWAGRGAKGPLLALELDPDLAALAARSAGESGCADVVTVRRGDVREYRTCLPHQALDRLASNPPYFAPGTGEPGAPARHGETFSLEDLAAAARWSLKDGGKLDLCLPAFRLGEAMHVLRAAGLEPKRLRLVSATPEKEPYLFLLECRKAGGTGLLVQRPLLLNGPEGRPTSELLEIYGEYHHD